MSYCNILEMKLGNDKFREPGNCTRRKGKIVIAIKDMKIIK